MQLCRTLSEGAGIVKGRCPAGDKNLMRDPSTGIGNQGAGISDLSTSQCVNASTGQLLKEKIGGLYLAHVFVGATGRSPSEALNMQCLVWNRKLPIGLNRRAGFHTCPF
jgi:hypothetical protein